MYLLKELLVLNQEIKNYCYVLFWFEFNLKSK